ncbi:hypothetical protein [Clostridium kluyveri]|nr:hypothetical protein [Clostridium kluyveri]
MMEYKNFINKECLIKEISCLSKVLYSRTDIIDFLKSNDKDILKEFTKEFWENPNQNITNLKKKYRIPNNISGYDIVKAHYCDKYIEFILDCWNIELTIEDMIEKYLIPYNKMENLLLQIHIELDALYCPNCISCNLFILDSSLKDIKENCVNFRCVNCGSRFNEAEKFLTKEEAAEELEKLKKRKRDFKKLLDDVNSQLQGEDSIKCYKCQSQLNLNYDDNNLSYYLECAKCGETMDNIEVAKTKYNKWKKRAAMMIAIKAQEQEIIEKTLQMKKASQVIFKKEDIIKEEDIYEAIDFIYEIQQMDALEGWAKVYQIARSCNRLERLVLLSILELCKDQNNKVTWRYISSDEKFTAYRFTLEDEPVVIKLYSKTNIVMLRTELKNLIEKKLIAVSEDNNYIDVMPILVDNIDSIRNLLKTQNVSAHLRYLIFEKHNFTCVRCGETGRPLRISYLTADKNNHDINLMTCLCDFCFEDATENEVLIDGSVTFDTQDEVSNRTACWDFVVNNFSELKNDDKIYKDIIKLLEKYDEVDLIKAFAITIERIKTNKLDNTVDALLRYTVGILNNSPDGIDISEKLIEKYSLENWIEKIQ